MTDNKYSLSAAERDVTINFSDADQNADIITYNPVWIRKFEKLQEQNPDAFQFVEEYRQGGRVIGKRWTFPKKLITIRAKDVKRELTDEQKEKQREHLQRMREMRFKS